MTHRVAITAAGLRLGEIVEDGRLARIDLRIGKLLPYELLRVRDAIDLYVQTLELGVDRVPEHDQNCSETEHDETRN